MKNIVPWVALLTPIFLAASARDPQVQNSLTTVTSTLMMFRRFTAFDHLRHALDGSPTSI